MDILGGLNMGSETIKRCRDTLMGLITAFDFDGKDTHSFFDTSSHD